MRTIEEEQFGSTHEESDELAHEDDDLDDEEEALDVAEDNFDVLHSLIELLVEKGVISQHELDAKIKKLDEDD